MSKYLLPCECGKEIAIDASQAGQQIACECGQLLEIPTLRDVRALEPDPETTSPSRQATEWNSSRGMIFAGSLIMLVIGVAISLFGYEGLQSTPNITREVETETFGEALDDMSLDEVYEMWKEIRDHGLGPRGQNAFVNIRSFRAGRQQILRIGIALCVVGLFGAIGATIVRRKSSA